MTQLVKYEAARNALQVAHSVDEVKDIRDKAQAMALYAKQANDTALVEWATEIKVRAERRAGEMLQEIERSKGGRGKTKASVAQVYRDNDIPPTTGKRWQKLAAVSEAQFEQAVAAAKEVAGEVTTAAMLRATKPVAPIEIATAGTQQRAAEGIDKHIKTITDLRNTQAENARLKEENAKLREQLAEVDCMLPELQALASAAEAFKEDQGFKRLHALEIENQSIKRRRDEAMREAVEAKRTAKHWRKEAEKLGWKAKGNGSAKHEARR